MIASIPSPGSASFNIGPLELRAYGLMIALGVLAAVWLAQRRWAALGNNPEEISRIAIWSVPAGLIGARLYHVITDWRRFSDDGWLEALAVWRGGLGIPGGLAAGIAMGLWMARRMRLNRGEALAAVVPALPLAQAIGRLGNWFNQELFGSPTDLPWAVEIDQGHRTRAYADYETFHPTFLYEALWNLALCVVLLRIDRRWRQRRAATQEPIAQETVAQESAGRARPVRGPGSLLAVYALGYGIGRLWIEAVRIDPASLLLGVRVNIWMSLALIASGLGYLLLTRPKSPQPSPPSPSI